MHLCVSFNIIQIKINTCYEGNTNKFIAAAAISHSHFCTLKIEKKIVSILSYMWIGEIRNKCYISEHTMIL